MKSLTIRLVNLINLLIAILSLRNLMQKREMI
nr:MAG TPA: hypothetical protein [Crassvirales sp.]